MGAGGDTVDKESVFANYKSVFSRQFAVSLAVEFVGVMFFQILGGTSAKEYAPFVNGFALAVWIYVAANISGGHLNPAVSFSTAVCGFYPVIHTVPVPAGSGFRLGFLNFHRKLNAFSTESGFQRRY